MPRTLETNVWARTLVRVFVCDRKYRGSRGPGADQSVDNHASLIWALSVGDRVFAQTRPDLAPRLHGKPAFPVIFS